MCKQCEKNPVYEFTNKRKLCKNCFIKWFQKKVLYTIRKFSLIKNDDVIGYKNKKDFREIVLEDILLMISAKGMVEIVKLPSKKKTNKTAISLNINLESHNVIDSVINKKISKLPEISPIQKIKNKIIIKPLYLFLDKEILLYAKLKKLKFNKEKIKEDKISKFIDDLEKKHPEIKRAIVNSYFSLN
jgi:hypothetical protein